jgi:hypothetical protein
VRQLSLALAFAAGLAGGVLSHYVWPQPVHAQSQNPKEIRAQSFVLEDANGKTFGTFSVEAPRPRGRLTAGGSIRLFDDRGREIWNSPFNGIGLLSTIK